MDSKLPKADSAASVTERDRAVTQETLAAQHHTDAMHRHAGCSASWSESWLTSPVNL